MIKSTDLIKKENRYFSYNSSNKTLKEACYNEAHRLIESKVDQKIYLSWNIKDLEKIEEHKKRINLLAARLEREFLRADKKSKYIILYGSDDLVSMNIYMFPINIVTPENPEDIIYGNAVFNSREEAERIAIAEKLGYYTIMVIPNEN